jgi:hypothetical protein
MGRPHFLGRVRFVRERPSHWRRVGFREQGEFIDRLDIGEDLDGSFRR